MSSVKRKTCRRCNFSRASFHLQNCSRSEFSLNLNLISEIRTDGQTEIQLRNSDSDPRSEIQIVKLTIRLEIRIANLWPEVEIQVLNSRPNFQDRVKNVRT